MRQTAKTRIVDLSEGIRNALVNPLLGSERALTTGLNAEVGPWCLRTRKGYEVVGQIMSGTGAMDTKVDLDFSNWQWEAMNYYDPVYDQAYNVPIDFWDAVYAYHYGPGSLEGPYTCIIQANSTSEGQAYMVASGPDPFTLGAGTGNFLIRIKVFVYPVQYVHMDTVYLLMGGETPFSGDWDLAWEIDFLGDVGGDYQSDHRFTFEVTGGSFTSGWIGPIVGAQYITIEVERSGLTDWEMRVDYSDIDFPAEATTVVATSDVIEHTFADTSMVICHLANTDMVEDYAEVDSILIQWGTATAQGPIRYLEQVRFPTTEKTYLLAQVEDDDGTNSLYVLPDSLPINWPPATFQALYTLGVGAGVISTALLNDVLVITEGTTKPPLVFTGGLSATPTDWPHPLLVYASFDGAAFHDVTTQVCDKDTDTAAAVGGINYAGGLYICLPVDTVSGFYFTMETPNGTAGGGRYTRTIELDNDNKYGTANLAGLAVYWKQDSGTDGHFEGLEQDFDAVAVHDYGDATHVGLPYSTSTVTAGDYIRVYGTVNYNGSYSVVLVENITGQDYIKVAATYAAETFNVGTEKHRIRHTLGSGNDCGDVEDGLRVSFETSGDAYILAITDDGEQDSEVELNIEVTSQAVVGMWGLEVSDDGLQVGGSTPTTAKVFEQAFGG